MHNIKSHFSYLSLIITQCTCVCRLHIRNKFDFQYVSLIDETPSYMGGKGNSWRKLTLDGKLKKPLRILWNSYDAFSFLKSTSWLLFNTLFSLTVLPRQTIFYDVVEYLYNKKLAPRLREEIPKLLLRPNNEKTKLEHIKMISEIRYAIHEIWFCHILTALYITRACFDRFLLGFQISSSRKLRSQTCFIKRWPGDVKTVQTGTAKGFQAAQVVRFGKCACSLLHLTNFKGIIFSEFRFNALRAKKKTKKKKRKSSCVNARDIPPAT